MRKLLSDITFIISSYMLIFSIVPSFTFLAPYFWPPVFAYISLKILCPLYLQIPFTFDLFRYASHVKIFKDSIRNLKIKPMSLLIVPLFILSFFLLKPSFTLWFSLWIVSSISKLIRNEKIKPNETYHWRFPTEIGKLINPKYPLLRKTLGFKGEKRFERKIQPNPNVIFIFLESFRAKNVGVLGAEHAFSPEFDKLSKEGALFTHFYANGLQTFRALISSLFGIPAHLETMSLYPFCHIPMIGLPQILKRAGYHTAHFQGNNSSFDWTHPFLQKAGFETIKGDEHFPESKKTSWGIHDEELFTSALEFLEKQEEPTFLSLFTISNHHPWNSPKPFEVPKDLPEDEMKFLQTFAYTDHCLGTFIRKLKEKGIYDHSLIFILGDHGQEINETIVHNNLSDENVHIPLLITGVTPAVIHEPASQVDLLPTVLDLLHLEAVHHSVGSSLVRKTENPAFISMIRDETTLRSIPESPLKASYFASIDELYQKKAWVSESFENVSFEIKAPIEADESWLSSQATLSPILDLSDTTFNDEGLLQMRKEQQDLLHELKISNNPHLSDNSLKWLAKNCTNLSILHAASCPRLTDKGLSEILSLPTLRYLNLEGSSIQKLSFKKPSDLSALHLRNCSEITSENFVQITENVPKLIYLSASLKKIESKDLEKVPLRDLNYLWLENGETIETKDINHLLAQNPKLQILILENFPNLTELNLQNHYFLQTVKFANCPKLENLHGIDQLKIKDLTLSACPKVGKMKIPKDCKFIRS